MTLPPTDSLPVLQDRQRLESPELHMKNYYRIVLAAVLLAGLSSSAFGKTRANPAAERAAKKACITGDVSKGVDILADLYLETGDITFVFNQARCYQQNHRWEEAIDRFEEFLRKSPDLGPAVRAEVDAYLADCRSHVAPPAPPAQPSGPVPSPVPSPAAALADSSAAQAPVPAAAVAAQPMTTARPGSGLRTAGIMVGAAGVAALVTGVVLDLKTHSIVDDVNRNGYDASKLSSRNSYETWGWVSFGVAAAGLAAGATLYLLGASADRAPSSGSMLSLVPVVDRRGAMVLLQGEIR
jgi:tetratricopeptide (TPR) repeat protein